MLPDFAEAIVAQFERGGLSRRQLVAQLMGLGALAARPAAASATEVAQGTFAAIGLDHIALDVADVARSRDFYCKHLGMVVIRDGGENTCFLGAEGKFFLTLFRGAKPGLNHYCYAIKDFDLTQAEAKLKAAGLKVRRESGRIYFADPDGIEVQISSGAGE